MYTQYKKASDIFSPYYTVYFLFWTFGKCISSEKYWYTPYSRNRYYYIYRSAYKRGCTSEHPCNKVKLKNSYKSPVDSTYDKENQCYFIPHWFHLFSYRLFVCGNIICWRYIFMTVNFWGFFIQIFYIFTFFIISTVDFW